MNIQTIQGFIKKIGDFQLANWSDQLGDALHELAEKEDFEEIDYADEVSELFEDYANWRGREGYLNGLERAYEMLKSGGLDTLEAEIKKRQTEIEKQFEIDNHFD